MAKDNDSAGEHPPVPTIGRKLLSIVIKIGKVLLVAVVAIMALYLVGVNVVLNTSFGRRLMMIRPEIVQVRYQRVWSIWPGRIHVTGADISGQDSENQFWVMADHAAMTFTPGGLAVQDVTGTNLRGDGVMIYIRRRVVKLPPADDLAKLPPIKGFPSPLKPDLPDVRVIGVRLQDIKAKNVREVWVDGYHVNCDIDAEGGMYYKPRMAVRVYPSNITIKDAKIITGDQPVASQLKGSVFVNVEEIDLNTLAQRDLALITAHTDLSMHIDGLRFANDMLPKDAGITLADGAALLTLAIKIDKGVLGESTKVKLEMPNLGVTVPMFRVKTAVELAVKVDPAEKHAVFNAELQSLTLTQRENGKTDVRSKVIRVKGHNNTLDLTKKMNVDVRADLPAVVADNLSFVNDFVPKGTAVSVEKGAAVLSGHFNFSSAKHRVDGLVDLEAKNLYVKNNTAHIVGVAKLHGLLHELDINSMNADLSGSWFALEDITVFLEGREVPNWKARVDLTKAVMKPASKRKADVVAKVYIKNLQPAVNIIGTNIKIPWIAKALAYRENVVANTRIELENDTLSVPRLAVENDSFVVQGRMQISDLKKKPPHQEAAILIKIAGLTIGIEIHDKSIKPILVNAQDWFDKREAAAGGPAASVAALQEGLEAGAAMGAMLGNAVGNAGTPVVAKAVGSISGGTVKPADINVKPALVPAVTPKVSPERAKKLAAIPPKGSPTLNAPVPVTAAAKPAVNAPTVAKPAANGPAAATPAAKPGTNPPAAATPAAKPAANAPATATPVAKPAANSPAAAKPAANAPAAATPATKPAANSSDAKSAAPGAKPAAAP